MRFMVFVRVKEEMFREFIQYLEEHKAMEQCFRLTGEYDAVLDINVDHMEEFYQFYRFLIKFPGLQAINSHVVAQEWNV